ncbi:MAG: DnaD domain protein [Anaerovoracaceae bacterium]|nr:DnaD domain protein [Anaerovoracaceae bacterium]
MGFRKEQINDYFLLDTGVENIFINEHMASAPGDFVKVYLLALMYANLSLDITNEEIARHLSLELEDVLKAWTYWEKLGAVKKIKKNPEDKFEYDIEFIVLKEQLYGKSSRKVYISEQNAQAQMADKEIKDMFAAIENITGRVISGTELMEVLSWINDFGAAPEVIVYGYSYCVQKKKKDIKYIAAVIKAWASEGLRDVISVEKYLSENEKKQYLYKRVFQALGFMRNATEEERRIMDTWFETMEFTLDKVLEACSKTSGIANPNINYVNKVLINWYEERKGGGNGPDGERKSLTAGEISRYYEALRSKNEAEAEERRRAVYDAVPKIKEIEDELTDMSSQMSKIIISDSVDRKSLMEQLKRRMDALNTEKAFLLTDNGFEIDHMDVKYRCPECRDTGMLETGERCQCFEEITREKINLISQ